MQGVIVEFQYEDGLDPTRVAAIAHDARGSRSSKSPSWLSTA